MKTQLSLLAGLWLGSIAMAQQPPTAPSPVPPYVPQPQPTVNAGPAPVIHYHVYSSATPAPCQSEAKPNWLQRKLGLCEKCQEHRDRLDAYSCSAGKKLGDFGCGSWRLDCIFIFGSCHEFFNEPCRRQVPVSSSGSYWGY